ncbi:hypothetical protein [Deefgea rivuli]|uniref:hypothetical protein n=1 Tax=Deefgea rivuli TaxID=400948 RepID=UPI000484943B|nr:hypothetical protein [Deefgea rivuli]
MALEQTEAVLFAALGSGLLAIMGTYLANCFHQERDQAQRIYEREIKDAERLTALRSELYFPILNEIYEFSYSLTGEQWTADSLERYAERLQSLYKAFAKAELVCTSQTLMAIAEVRQAVGSLMTPIGIAVKAQPELRVSLFGSDSEFMQKYFIPSLIQMMNAQNNLVLALRKELGVDTSEEALLKFKGNEQKIQQYFETIFKAIEELNNKKNN